MPAIARGVRGHGPLLQEILLGGEGAVTNMTESFGQAALRRGRVSISGTVYHLTVTTIDRTRHFENFNAGCAAARCFEDSAILQSSTMLAWVLMPDHVHWLLELGSDDTLEQIANRLKSSSSRTANQILQRSGPLWQKAYYDHALRTDETVTTVASYILANPLRAGLVTDLNDYPFWNCVWGVGHD